jgi:hypothetical protein
MSASPASDSFACPERATQLTSQFILSSIRSARATETRSLSFAGSAPRPGYINQVVTVELQRANQSQFVGTSCWHDAGIVVRAQEAALVGARVFLDAPGTIEVLVLDRAGRALSPGIRIAKDSNEARIGWQPIPPDSRGFDSRTH